MERNDCISPLDDFLLGKLSEDEETALLERLSGPDKGVAHLLAYTVERETSLWAFPAGYFASDNVILHAVKQLALMTTFTVATSAIVLSQLSSTVPFYFGVFIAINLMIGSLYRLVGTYRGTMPAHEIFPLPGLGRGLFAYAILAVISGIVCRLIGWHINDYGWLTIWTISHLLGFSHGLALQPSEGLKAIAAIPYTERSARTFLAGTTMIFPVLAFCTLGNEIAGFNFTWVTVIFAIAFSYSFTAETVTEPRTYTLREVLFGFACGVGVGTISGYQLMAYVESATVIDAVLQALLLTWGGFVIGAAEAGLPLGTQRRLANDLAVLVVAISSMAFLDVLVIKGLSLIIANADFSGVDETFFRGTAFVVHWMVAFLLMGLQVKIGQVYFNQPEKGDIKAIFFGFIAPLRLVYSIVPSR